MFVFVPKRIFVVINQITHIHIQLNIKERVIEDIQKFKYIHTHAYIVYERLRNFLCSRNFLYTQFIIFCVHVLFVFRLNLSPHIKFYMII